MAAGPGQAASTRVVPGSGLDAVLDAPQRVAGPCNSSLNRLRAAVERSIAHPVNWKVLDTGWRGRLTDFPEALRTVTGLEIYRTWGWSLSE
jgi:hypothetical protein